ncbi:hypothetical protein Tco_0161711 [Tanacetum coccineum]
MDLYNSRLTQDVLNELIIRYKIAHDLYHRLPSEDFVMSKLLDDAIDRANGDVVSSLLDSLQTRGLRAIPDYMTWRHPDSAIDEPKHVVGSYRMTNVRHLSAHVVKLRDMPEGVLVLFGLSHVWKSWTCDLVLQGADGNVMGIHDFLCLPKWTSAEVQVDPHHDIRPTFQRLPFYCTPAAAVDVIILDLTPKELVVSNPSAKVIAKAEASRKQKAFSSGSADGSSAESYDDDDACYEILIVTPIRSASMIPPSRNQSRGSAVPAAEGLNTRERFLGMPFIEISFPSPIPIMSLILKVVLLGIASLLVRSGMLLTSLSKGSDQGSFQGSLCFGELLARYRGLLQSHHEQIAWLNDKLFASDALFAKSKAKGKERKKKIKSLTKSLDNLHAEVARLFANLNWATALVQKFLASDEFIRVQAELLSLAASARIGLLKFPLVAQTDNAFLNKISKHAAEPLSIILQLEPKNLARLTNIPASRDAYVFPPIVKEWTMTLASTSLELLSNTVLTSSAAALEQNEE